jgi:alginate O-acetyltransferase complex protein AlgJ
MVTSNQAPLTREAIAQIEVGHTDIGPGTIRFLVAFFVVSIAAVPLFEVIGARSDEAGFVTPWSHLARIPAEASARTAADRTTGDSTTWSRVVAGNRAVLEGLHAFEEALEDESRLGRTLRPPAQLLMSAWLGAGNERAYAGREGWLFYRPDVEYVTGAGFLERTSLERRIDLADEWTRPPQPDAVAAILSFKRRLDAAGIALIVVPTPLKPSVHPEFLAAGYEEESGRLQNPSFDGFLAALRQQGVLVFDPTRALVESARSTQTTQYLATDTHWRPEAMETVAHGLADFVRTHVTLPERSTGYRLEPLEVSHLGDIAVMLDLPEGQRLYSRETVTVRRVVSPDGSPWRSSREADVLVLGDSFSNIFSLQSMGWGEGAGLVEHISYVLQRPVDRIVQNDQGAFATRELLHRAGPARLTGKRVVIYQFAARELMFGDWKVFE